MKQDKIALIVYYLIRAYMYNEHCKDGYDIAMDFIDEEGTEQ